MGGQPMSSTDFDTFYNCGGLADDNCGLESIIGGEWRDGVGLHYRQRLPLVRTQFGPTDRNHMAPQEDPAKVGLGSAKK